MKKNVLLAVHTVTFFNELSRVGKVLRASGRYEPIFIFPHFYPSQDQQVAIALKAGFTCLNAHGEKISPPEKSHSHLKQTHGKSLRQFLLKRKTFKQLLRASGLSALYESYVRLKDFNNRNFDSFLFDVWYLRHRINFVRRIIRAYTIELLILGGDLTHYDTGCFIRAAKKQAIPSVIVPCSMLSGPLDVAETLLPLQNHHLTRLQNRLFAKYHPEWVYVHKGHSLLRLTAGRALAMCVLRLAPPLPWINLSGFADCIAVENEAMFDFYIGQGIPKNQLQVTGLPGDDALYANLMTASESRKALYARIGMPSHKPMILCALPPDQFYMVGGRPECEFRNYPELVQFWIQTLASTEKYNVIVNLHPITEYGGIKPFERRGVKIVQDDITSLIPLCEIFVASISSVIRWAIACGKPVLNYDVYLLRYTDYKNATGVLTMEKKEEFQNAFQKLTHDEQYYENMKMLQEREAHRWGKLDGQAQSRLLQLFDSVVK